MNCTGKGKVIERDFGRHAGFETLASAENEAFCGYFE